MAEIILKGICTTTEFEAFERRLFEKLNMFIENQSESRDWLTSNEAMDYLRVKQTKFYDLINNGLIKQYDLDGSKRYLRQELFEAVRNSSNS